MTAVSNNVIGESADIETFETTVLPFLLFSVFPALVCYSCTSLSFLFFSIIPALFCHTRPPLCHSRAGGNPEGFYIVPLKRGLGED